MAELSIPSEEFATLSKIATLDDLSFNEFLSALSVTPPALAHKTYIARLAPLLPSFKNGRAGPLVRTLVALYHVKESTGHSAQELSNLVLEAAAESPEHREKFVGDSAVQLQDRLMRLLSLDTTLGIGAKCIALMRKEERVYVKSVMSADMRAVLSEDGASISGAAIAFDLRIDYVHDRKRTEMHIGLDEEDLIGLKGEIEKAEKKCARIKQYLANSGIFYLNND